VIKSDGDGRKDLGVLVSRSGLGRRRLARFNAVAPMPGTRERVAVGEEGSAGTWGCSGARLVMWCCGAGADQREDGVAVTCELGSGVRVVGVLVRGAANP